MSGGLVQHLDRLTVKGHLLLFSKKRLSWPGAKGHGRLFAGRSAHAHQDVVVGEDLGPQFDVGEITSDIRAGDGCARPTHGVISTSVIRMNVSVEDVLNRLVRQLTDPPGNPVPPVR